MKHTKKITFSFIIFMTILSITFNPFSAKAAPLMLNLPEPQVDQLYIGDDYITTRSTYALSRQCSLCAF